MVMDRFDGAQMLQSEPHSSPSLLLASSNAKAAEICLPLSSAAYPAALPVSSATWPAAFPFCSAACP